MKSIIAVLYSWLPGHSNKTQVIARVASLLLLAALAAGQLAQAQTLVLQLKSPNYNPTNGLWTATVGPNAQGVANAYPLLTTNASPNGSPAVVFNGTNRLQLATSIPVGSYTAFAYVMPATGAGPYALFGGASGSFEYRLYNSKQDVLVQQTADLGSETTALSTSAFNLIDTTVSSSGGSFRLNGVADGNNSAGSFTQPISAIGARASTGGESFSGSICEIDIYSGVLNSSQISAVEAALTASYVTTGPTLIIGLAAVSPTNNVYAGAAVSLSAPVTGATNTTTFQWQTDNGSGGTSFANISGATATNYVLNTSSLLGTYEYQLIGTPFGGNSVTSAPVTLTVQAASAPVLVTDTTATPAVATVAGNETFSAAFVGNSPISYQWQVSANSSGSGAVNIAGATNSTLVLNNLQLTNSGYYYSLQASNAIAPYIANSSWAQLNVQTLTPLVQLIASNYNSGSGVWSDSSGNGNNATYTDASDQTNQPNPALVSAATPNGASAVSIGSSGGVHSGSFLLTSSLDPSSGYTVFAYFEPTTAAGRNAFTGGSAGGALEYDLNGGHQDFLQEYQADVANGTATIPTNSFSLIDLAVNSSTYAFRFNGAADGSGTGVSFSQPITRIGNNEGGGDNYLGEIAEIDIYNGALTSIQITNIEAQLTAKYGIAGTVPAAVTGLKFTAKPVISGTGLTISATNTGAGTFYLLTSTNVASPLSTWTPIWTNAATGSGSFTTNLTGAVNPALKQQFYILSNTNN
jgi:hypothetical protein